MGCVLAYPCEPDKKNLNSPYTEYLSFNTGLP